MTKLTLEELLKREHDHVLADIQMELLSNVVPKGGAAHTYCRRVNKMIDAGECCINPYTYRKVYLPTLAKALQRELARRYTQVYTLRRVVIVNKKISDEDARQLNLFEEGYLHEEL